MFYSLSFTRAFVSWNERSSEHHLSNRIGACSIVQSHVLSSLSYNTCFHFTAVAYRSKICIAQWSLYIKQISYEYLSNVIISATVYYPNLKLLVAQIFCHFCLCTNCERTFNINDHFYIETYTILYS